jgi:hypothetical protein
VINGMKMVAPLKRFSAFERIQSLFYWMEREIFIRNNGVVKDLTNVPPQRARRKTC